jgi:hypothetical protein
MFFSKNRYGEFHPKANKPKRRFIEKKKKKKKSSNTCKTSTTNPETKQKLTPNLHKPHAPVFIFYFFYQKMKKHKSKQL